MISSTSFEVEIDLSGDEDRADMSVGYPGGYADLSVDGLYGLTAIRGTRPQQWRRFDLLQGLDDKAKACVLANIQAHVGDDAIMEALDAEASDPAADRADYLRDLRVDQDSRELGKVGK